MKFSNATITRKSILVLIGIAACVVESVCQVKVEMRLAAEVSQSRLLGQVRDLVGFGPRIGGTTSGEKAASYVARKFKEAGYRPSLIKDPLRLTFEYKSWTLSVERPRELRKLIRNEWIGGFSPSVPETTAGLFYVKDVGDAKRGDVTGKAVLTRSTFSEQEYLRLAGYGATCVLEISPHLADAYSEWAYINDLPSTKLNPIPLFNLSYRNGESLIRALADSENVVIRFSSKAVIDSTGPKTVVAMLEGESDKYYIVCAHGDSDSGGPGADDNASGVSTVLETARVLKKLVATHEIPKPKCSVKFIVWGAEIFSTENYVKLHSKELDKILGVLNLDEVGIGAARNCLYFESNDVKHNDSLMKVLDSLGGDYAGKKGFWSEATTNPSQGGTDSYVFFPRYLKSLKVPDVKIPSVTIYTAAWNELKPIPQTPGWRSKAWHGPVDTVYADYSPYYHSSLDVPKRTTEVEPFNMVGAGKAVGIALLRLAW
jgi:hypothetical protein